MKRWRETLIALGAAVSVSATMTAARGADSPDEGRPFVPRPVSQPIYGEQRQPGEYLTLNDGARLYYELWMPAAAADGPPVPAKVPAVIVATPYGDSAADNYNKTRPEIVSRGYAVVFLHIPGTGRSSGCWDFVGERTGRAFAEAIELLAAKDWSDGTFASFGISFDADTQLAMLTMADPPDALKAAVVAAAIPAQYELDFFDGGRYGTGFNIATFGLGLGDGIQRRDPQYLGDYVSCYTNLSPILTDISGNFTEFWRALDYRPGAATIDVPIVVMHGMNDFQTEATDVFRMIPDSTPHIGLFGWWEHGIPASFQNVTPEHARADTYDLITAWFDRYLRGHDTGVEEWPRVQVQGSDGQWREERSWPETGGPIGALALGAAGALGATLPSGSTSYVEGYGRVPAPGTSAVFETPPLPERLELTGRPVLDAWVTLDKNDAAISARIEVIGADGQPERYHAAMGMRSAQHLEPFGEKGYFDQGTRREAEVDKPIRVPVRFDTTDLVIPKGGKLRLIVAGSVANAHHDQYDLGRDGGTVELEGQSVTLPGGLPVAVEPFFYTFPSGRGTRVTIHHDCLHPSVLRFQLPSARPALLDVRDKDEAEPAMTPPPPPSMRRAVESTGGGLATTPVCGQRPTPPERLLRFGE